MSSDGSSFQANCIVYGQQNSRFDGFCDVWTIKRKNGTHLGEADIFGEPFGT